MIKKRLLLITTFFPPRQHTATQRNLAWVKYLDRDKIDIEVLAPYHPDRDVAALEKEFHIKIHQIKASPWPGLLTIRFHDSFIGRKLKALHNKFFYNFVMDEWPSFTMKAKKYVNTRMDLSKLDYVLSSYAPIGPHLIALKIKHLNPQIKWIADFRDEMSLGESVPKILRSGLAKAESIICGSADIVTSVSEPILLDFKRHAPHSTQFLEIRNGFDFEPILDSKALGDRIKIGYFGTFYGHRNAKKFISILQEYNSSNPPFKIELHVYGNNYSASGLPDIIFHKPLNYQDVPKALTEQDAFLMIQPSKQRLGVFTSKLFDYLAVNRPILALVDPKDVAGTTIKEQNAGLTFAYEQFELDNLKEFVEFILSYRQRRSLDQISQFGRSHQVKILQNGLLNL